MARAHRHCGTSVSQFCHGERSAQSSIANLLHTSKPCLRKDACDAVWTGCDPTTGDGRPPFDWDEKVRAFHRGKQLGDWKETSTETWHRFKSEFVTLIAGRERFFLYKVACALTQDCHVGVQADLT